MSRLLGALALCAGVMVWPGFALAQDVNVQALVDQLRAPRARGLGRNLVEVPESSSAAAAVVDDPLPSVSLRIEFDAGSAQIRPESRGQLMLLAEALKSLALGDARFVVEGHTDAKGKSQDNLRLSQARAQVVRDRLVFLGVPPGRLTATGRGADDPAVPSDPLAAENRRVRIVRSAD